MKEVNKKVITCDMCSTVLKEYEQQIVLGNYYCHTCLINRYIKQNTELYAYKNNPNKKYDKLKKSTKNLLETIQNSCEGIIDDCIEITEDRTADFNACREMDMSFNHAEIIVNSKK